ncbi:MAG: hypothetical protein R3313_00740 [Candidatus Saccharimonadales bacterium]|nr:hypothetical protein [Candidatus Saccharimonadales bacterium]
MKNVSNPIRIALIILVITGFVFVLWFLFKPAEYEAITCDTYDSQAWEVPINLDECQPCQNRFTYLPFGSSGLTTRGLKGDSCIFEYTSETEGAYTTYECSLKRSIGLVEPVRLFSDENCREVDSGNLLLQ